ncbi:MAG: substrate-binding domain-containing protein [Candidatus Methylacidiphilales bacterium]|nr:substrate-binding domain-containing protein [Candidatus Methylacidiphilales bacterium]
MIASLGPLPQGDDSVAKYRQISEHLRDLIQNGELRPGTRLPGMIALAKQWDTNYFTVASALTPLANEGLIRRTPRGTFVQNRRSTVTAVALYYGTNPWDDPEGSYYQQAYRELRRELESCGIACQLFMDLRPLEHQHVPLPELIRAMERREVQGVVGLMLNSQMVRWLENLPVPMALLSTGAKDKTLGPMFGEVLDSFVRHNCRSVGIIFPTSQEIYPEFEAACLERGIRTKQTWVRKLSRHSLMRGEHFGYQEFKHLWSLPAGDRPEGIYVMPDWVCRGVITAALELGVRVPGDVRFVLFSNAGLEYVCPWKVPMMVSDVRKSALALVNHLLDQDPARPGYGQVANPHARLVE